MLTYENVTKVRLNGKHVGDIKQNTHGFYYKPKGSKLLGAFYDSIEAVKSSLEADA